NVVLLNQIQEGAADQSYGIHVANLAGLPSTLIERANSILGELENKTQLQSVQTKEETAQLSFFAEEEKEKPKEQTNDYRNNLVEQLKNINLLELRSEERRVGKECRS